MLFNSIEFAIFLPVVFILYWFIFNRNLRSQNALLIVASYFFYGWWDWRFLSLLFFSSLVDFLVGIGLSLQKKPARRKLLLMTSVTIQISLLGFFKYFNFFAQSFSEAFTLLGHHMEPTGLKIILPVGISFYTFQTLSYTIDVYRHKNEPTRDIITFFAYVSFFPQLVAGPIERAHHLLPQFSNKRKFDYSNATDGMRQILWGLFKKIVIADNCAGHVNHIFANSPDHSGSTLLLGAVLFAFQIYCDFSGYSDIAIGTAKLFGISLMRNFAFPYFSRDIAEFWRRWHISLSTWFRDYLYYPLGGSRGGTWMKIRNTFAIFLVSGFWHGANWTYIAWGFLNACYFLPLMLLNKNRKNTDIAAEGKLLPNLKELSGILFTFFLTVIAWIFFRAASIHQSFDYLSGIFDISLFSIPDIMPFQLFFMIFILLAVEWLQRDKQHALQFGQVSMPKYIRWGIYYTIILTIILFGAKEQEFIYFQF